jgi:rubrerythrin
VKYTERQKAGFKAKFIQTRRYQMALFVPVGGAVFLLLRSDLYAEDLGFETMVLGAAFLLLVAAGFSWLNWRCPACRKFLGRGLSPKQCPKCGVELTSQ